MTTTPLDGQQASPDSADLIAVPPVAQSDPPPAPDAVPPSADPSKLLDKNYLAAIGITKKVAQRMLAGSGSTDYLNTKVTAKIFLVHQANSAEEIMRAQHKAGLMGKDKTIDARVRSACLAVVAQCAMALARLSEVAISTARNLDIPEEQGKGKVFQPTQNNFFGFPPVSDARPKSATNGESTPIDIPSLVKSV